MGARSAIKQLATFKWVSNKNVWKIFGRGKVCSVSGKMWKTTTKLKFFSSLVGEKHHARDLKKSFEWQLFVFHSIFTLFKMLATNTRKCYSRRMEEEPQQNKRENIKNTFSTIFHRRWTNNLWGRDEGKHVSNRARSGASRFTILAVLLFIYRPRSIIFAVALSTILWLRSGRFLLQLNLPCARVIISKIFWSAALSVTASRELLITNFHLFSRLENQSISIALPRTVLMDP